MTGGMKAGPYLSPGGEDSIFGRVTLGLSSKTKTGE